MSIILFGMVFLISTTKIQSQNTTGSDFFADRPGLATSPFIMGPKSLQMEMGFSYERITEDNRLKESIVYPSTLLRFGLNSNSEIRFQADYEKVKTDSLNVSGFRPLTIGTKLYISEGKGLIPKTSLLCNLTLPGLVQKNFRASHLAPSLYLLMQNDVSRKINLGYNIGIEYDGEEVYPTTFLAISIGLNFSDRLSGFLENYNWFSPKTKAEDFIDLGLAYLIYKNLQIDVSGNLNIQDSMQYSMINFGLAYRMAR